MSEEKLPYDTMDHYDWHGAWLTAIQQCYNLARQLMRVVKDRNDAVRRVEELEAELAQSRRWAATWKQAARVNRRALSISSRRFIDERIAYITLQNLLKEGESRGQPTPQTPAEL